MIKLETKWSFHLLSTLPSCLLQHNQAAVVPKQWQMSQASDDKIFLLALTNTICMQPVSQNFPICKLRYRRNVAQCSFLLLILKSTFWDSTSCLSAGLYNGVTAGTEVGLRETKVNK